MPTAAATTSTRHVIIDSPIGPLTLVRDDGDDSGLTGLYYPGHWTRPDRNSFGPRVESSNDHGFDEAIAQLSEYFAGERQNFDLPLNPRGSDQARQVWQLLAEIPYGQTTTYGALAGKIGGGVNARDIGGVVGDNPLSIFIPCHRVVGSTGKLTGYAGGLDRKRYLLQLEKAIPAAPQTLW
jgi:methylated-DNA-[protein]-cysteine S-methyltransferase